MMITFLALYVATSCNNQPKGGTTKKFIDAANIDSTIKPGDNFFLWANGAWLKKAVIPATESSVGGFSDLRKSTSENLHAILEELAKAANPTGSLEQKVGDFYASAMDSVTIENLGHEPIKPWLQKIEAIKTNKEVMAFVAEQQTSLIPLLFQTVFGADEKNSIKNITIFYQGGLGLPDRDYYFKTDAATLNVVTAYQTYLNKLFSLTGDDSTKAAANTKIVYDLEKQLASAHRTNVELRDPKTNYNKLSVSALQAQTPNFGWNDLLSGMNIKTDSINVGQPGYFMHINKLLASVPVDTWKLYLKAHLLSTAAPVLSSNFVNAHFDYTGKALAGQKQLKARWQRMVTMTDQNLGEALGQVYVKKYFTEESKKRMQELVNNLTIAFEARIKKLDWMSDDTKQKALAKLGTFLRKIGFPDKWKDYSTVTINKDKFFENLIACRKNEYSFQVKKVGNEVDKTEWQMTPPTINAYYNPTFNEIVFPAGILQFPFFDANADDAVNYGGIGMVIGHEITHGFDDQGAQYDKDGNLKNWWAKEDEEKFKEKTKAVSALYSTFTVLDSLHVNGDLTTGENMADFGGIAIAYDAFKLTAQGKSNEKIDGFTPDQRFFLSIAQIWKNKLKDEAIRQRIATDPHSPAIWRVNGPLMNFEPFYAAFNIKEGDKMHRSEKDRIKIW